MVQGRPSLEWHQVRMPVLTCIAAPQVGTHFLHFLLFPLTGQDNGRVYYVRGSLWRGSSQHETLSSHLCREEGAGEGQSREQAQFHLHLLWVPDQGLLFPPSPTTHLCAPAQLCALGSVGVGPAIGHVRRGHLCSVGGVRNHPGLGWAAST